MSYSLALLTTQAQCDEYGVKIFNQYQKQQMPGF